MAKKTSWKGLDAAFNELEAEVTDVARGVTVHLFYSIMARTPQYYGGMTASWTYNFNGVGYDRTSSIPERTTPDGPELYGEKAAHRPRGKGDERAIRIAVQASAGKDSQFALGKKVYITNGVRSPFEGPYGEMVESWEGSPPLRGVNLPGQPMKRALNMIQSKYGLGVKKKDVPELKAWRIGV